MVTLQLRVQMVLDSVLSYGLCLVVVMVLVVGTKGWSLSLSLVVRSSPIATLPTDRCVGWVGVAT